jgi:hypothetical protein
MTTLGAKMPPSRRKQYLLTAFLLAPLALVVLLIVLIARSLEHPPQKQPPIGAGAGDTGGANAVGEALEHRSAPE